MNASDCRRHADGSIDYGFYHQRASMLRSQARSEAVRKLWAMTKSAVAYCKFPQKRWMRLQASSRSDVLVA